MRMFYSIGGYVKNVCSGVLYYSISIHYIWYLCIYYLVMAVTDVNHVAITIQWLIFTLHVLTLLVKETGPDTFHNILG